MFLIHQSFTCGKSSIQGKNKTKQSLEASDIVVATWIIQKLLMCVCIEN